MLSIALALKDIPLDRVTFVQYPGVTGGDGVYAGKVQPQQELADELFALIRADQPFVLPQAGDGEGATVDPNAPAPDPSAGQGVRHPRRGRGRGGRAIRRRLRRPRARAG